MMTVISTILAVAKAVPIVNAWIQALIAQYVTQQDATTISKIADAAALAARAQTDAERYAAAQNWRDVLSCSRFIS